MSARSASLPESPCRTVFTPPVRRVPYHPVRARGDSGTTWSSRRTSRARDRDARLRLCGGWRGVRLGAVRAASHALRCGGRAGSDALSQHYPVFPVAQSRVAALARLEHRLGAGDPIVLRPHLRGGRCDSLVAAGSRGRRGRSHMGRQADGHQLYSAREHGGRDRTIDRAAGPGDVKKRALVPYQADYVFYKEIPRRYRD